MSNNEPETTETTDDAPTEPTEPTEATTSTATAADDVRRNTPGKGRKPDARAIEAAAPDEFGLVQAWWGGGKGKTTAALGMAFRAAGHGFRVHVLQLMKGGADSVEDVRGEYNAIAAVPGISYENLGHYGWAGMRDGSDEADHATQAEAGFERAKELVAAAGEADLSEPLPLDGDPEDGVHLLVVDELLYAVSMGLLDESAVVDFVESKPENLELVLTGSHDRPEYLDDVADLITQVKMEKHPFETGQRARKGTEY
ncbi:cob(I)alamin adenosyltransferase [Halogranum gelatinilyticum]|uniref:Cob(I)alamin adenosyltransferase n=1 Tax=Halogranum gelatinilyticum TaxID=660521 RepID=A0A1G9Q7D7_9EURY|nr:cob(I)yrinic acid a,c-diamide adenosyltransferase [Halogranum gelatinilyticum]SDM06964.1 cob(I)alamin adenosyltransferase [Halogranum gelatinilyticum]